VDTHSVKKCYPAAISPHADIRLALLKGQQLANITGDRRHFCRILHIAQKISALTTEK
jgi:hypothetical protein